MWLTGLVAPRHVGSSQTRARTRVPCIGRRILNHCATREAPSLSFFIAVSLQKFLVLDVSSILFFSFQILCFPYLFCGYVLSVGGCASDGQCIGEWSRGARRPDRGWQNPGKRPWPSGTGQGVRPRGIPGTFAE